MEEGRLVKTFFPCRGLAERVAVSGKGHPEHAADLVVIIDDQDSCPFSHDSLSLFGTAGTPDLPFFRWAFFFSL
jgi:hypothetical protein